MSSSSTTPINRTVRKRKGKGNNIIRGEYGKILYEDKE
jgi:hypothetical protein